MDNRYLTYTVSEAVDRYTIMQVEQENGKMIDTDRLAALSEFIGEAGVSLELIDKLYDINAAMWPLQDAMMRAGVPDKTVAEIARKVMRLNGDRRRVRSEIAKEYGGYQETTTYAP